MYYQNSKFDLFQHFWPQVTFITSWHLSSESLRQERHFYTPWIHFQWLLKCDLLSEFLTSGDLCWPCGPFFGKLTSRASFWYTIYPLSMVLKFDLFSKFWPWVTFVDLGWPLLTSWPLFLKSCGPERHFDIQFSHFQWLLKFDREWPQNL